MSDSRGEYTIPETVYVPPKIRTDFTPEQVAELQYLIEAAKMPSWLLAGNCPEEQIALNAGNLARTVMMIARILVIE